MSIPSEPDQRLSKLSINNEYEVISDITYTVCYNSDSYAPEASRACDSYDEGCETSYSSHIDSHIGESQWCMSIMSLSGC